MTQSERIVIRHKCGTKLLEMDCNTVLVNHIAYCRSCKQEVIIDAVKGKILSIRDMERKEVEAANEKES